MRDRTAAMSMFDYDARPVTPLLVLVGETAFRTAAGITDPPHHPQRRSKCERR
jgi:hypothetical protein